MSLELESLKKKSLFKTITEWTLMMLGFVYWAVVGSAITIIGTLLYWCLPLRYSLPCGRFLLQKAFQVFIAYFRVAGLLILNDEELVKLSQCSNAMIIAPNHIALWDAVFIIARIPETICIMKGAILRNPILGGGARLAGYIPNDSTSQMLLKASAQLQQGEKLLVFPEGTRTKPDAIWLNQIQGAVAILAKHSSVPVVPVYIRSNSRFFEKGRPLFKMPDFPLRIDFTIGKPIQFKAEESNKDFSSRLESIYVTELSKPHPLRRKQKTDE